MKNPEFQPLQVWGGMECTINRIQHRYLDQFELAGVYHNPDYIESIIGLGINQVRFPVLWEKHQPSLNTEIDWSFSEESLNKFRLHNIEPVAGLIHHGSGPAFTDLLQDDFPELFAAYAGKVAGKFPWIKFYTPVNEPLTTARFSGLYGIWYPHRRSDVSLLKCLLNELKASVLAMQEIRKINPLAQFIQTEDLAKTYSTALLSYQADFENHRRWLTYDILCGYFTQSHPLWEHVMRLGIEENRLQFFIDNPCPPDVLGVNYYLTSERYLDEHIEDYPIETIGGNTIHRYADTEVVRVQITEQHGLEHLLKELWQRYKIPIAITEVHLNCTREEQLRWFNYVYETAIKVRKNGIDLRAVCAWALLGSFGWNKLLTADSCDYEVGAFDISAGYARPTALSKIIKDTIQGKTFPKYLTMQAGWWIRDSRFFKPTRKLDDFKTAVSVQPAIIICEKGSLGNAFARICRERNIHHFLLEGTEAVICTQGALTYMIDSYNPWAIINASTFSEAGESNNEIDNGRDVAFIGNLAAACKQYDIKLLSLSSDHVFYGEKCVPYVETDMTSSSSNHDVTNQRSEKAIIDQYPEALIIRTATLFGECDGHNFLNKMLSKLYRGKHLIASDEIVVSPTYIPHLVNASLDLLIDNASGVWHLANRGWITWYGLAKKIVEQTSMDPKLVRLACHSNTHSERIESSALASIKYNLMPTLDEALNKYIREYIKNEICITQDITDERL